VRGGHDALPDLAVSEIDTTLTLFGKKLRAPIFIAAMTGGTDEAGRVNRELARMAEARGYGFGLGSQRAMHKDQGVSATYRVRDVAPNALVLGNLGVVQARDLATDEVRALAASVGADALCVHLNPAMELIQKDGDRDFRSGAATIGRLCHELDLPVVVKETGCGLSPSVGRRLAAMGVRHVDVSGAGGTSWVGVETLRARSKGDEHAATLGEALWDWGIPTAASVAAMEPLGFETVIATGGIKSGLDVARALALGATAAGIARPVLTALQSGGPEAAGALLEAIEAELRAAMVLTGSRNLAALREAPRIVTGELASWVSGLGGR
jgi:isopentenyl-diphosphate delta-isomerase